MPKFYDFLSDVGSIGEVFRVYFGSQKAFQISENSGMGSERRLEASGVGFWEPWRLQKWIPGL